MAKQKKEAAAEVVEQEPIAVDATETVIEPLTPQETTLAPLNEFDVHLETFKPYLELKINGPEDKAGFKKVEAARLEVKRVKVRANNIGDAIIEPFNKVVQAINQRRKFLKTGFGDIEDHLKNEVELYEAQVAEKERKKKEEEDAKIMRRVDQLTALGCQWSGTNAYRLGDITISWAEIQSLDDERFIETTSLMETEAVAIREQQRIKEEQEAAEKAAQEAEAQRLKDEAARLEKEKKEFEEKKEADRIAAEKAEEERLEKIRKEDEEREVDRLKKQKEADEKMKQATVAMRKAQLISMGMTQYPDTKEFVYKDTDGPIDDIQLYSNDDEWDSIISEMSSHIARYDQELEEEKKLFEQKQKREIELQERRDSLISAGLKKNGYIDKQWLYNEEFVVMDWQISEMSSDIFSSFLASVPDLLTQIENRIKSAEELRQAKIDSLRPDKEKLTDIIEKIAQVTDGFEFKTTEAKEVCVWLETALSEVAITLQSKIEGL